MAHFMYFTHFARFMSLEICHSCTPSLHLFQRCTFLTVHNAFLQQCHTAILTPSLVPSALALCHPQMEVAMLAHKDAALCVLTTTSCFAPRASDDVEAVARLCKHAGVPHIINNAYGVQVRLGWLQLAVGGLLCTKLAFSAYLTIRLWTQTHGNYIVGKYTSSVHRMQHTR